MGHGRTHPVLLTANAHDLVCPCPVAIEPVCLCLCMIDINMMNRAFVAFHQQERSCYREARRGTLGLGMGVLLVALPKIVTDGLCPLVWGGGEDWSSPDAHQFTLLLFIPAPTSQCLCCLLFCWSLLLLGHGGQSGTVQPFGVPFLSLCYSSPHQS